MFADIVANTDPVFDDIPNYQASQSLYTAYPGTFLDMKNELREPTLHRAASEQCISDIDKNDIFDLENMNTNIE